MIPSPVLASSSPYADALQKANSLKQIIISDVPECTWTENTVCANTFPLYDIDLNVNGYVFEFETNGSPSGFIQIDLSTGEARLDSYCFSGVHTSNIMKQGQKEPFFKRKNNPFRRIFIFDRTTKCTIFIDKILYGSLHRRNIVTRHTGKS